VADIEERGCDGEAGKKREERKLGNIACLFDVSKGAPVILLGEGCLTPFAVFVTTALLFAFFGFESTVSAGVKTALALIAEGVGDLVLVVTVFLVDGVEGFGAEAGGRSVFRM
jgi:hypothetical protein